MNQQNILEVKNLNMIYTTLEGNVNAVNDLSFEIKKGSSFGLVGESGCGKTSVAMTLMQLQADNAKIVSGNILFDGQEMVGLNEKDLRKIRWGGISIVFQGAMNAWNPVIKVGEQIREAIEDLTKLGYVEALIDKDCYFHFTLTSEGIKLAEKIQEEKKST